MRITLAILGAAAIGIGGAGFGAAPASAQTPQPLVHESAAESAAFTEIRWRGHRGAQQRRHAGRHGHTRHRGWHRGRDRGRDAAAGIIGFGAGALLGQALAPRHYPAPQTYAYGGQVSSAHVQWCQQRYRSYDVRTDSFLSYDGNRYRCNSPY